jgi:hypothetical protein
MKYSCPGSVREKSDVRVPVLIPRRFPVPWTFEDHNSACFIVKDHVEFDRFAPYQIDKVVAEELHEETEKLNIAELRSRYKKLPPGISIMVWFALAGSLWTVIGVVGWSLWSLF